MVDTNLATVRVGWLIDRVNLVSPPVGSSGLLCILYNLPE